MKIFMSSLAKVVFGLAGMAAVLLSATGPMLYPPLCRGSPNVEVSLDPPGGLVPWNTPQMIVMTFDDSVSSARFAVAEEVLVGRLNPNGTPVQATFFVLTDHSDYWLAHRLHAYGHEIAVHTMTHTTDEETDLETWRAEIVGAHRALSRFANIPVGDVRGFRAPCLDYNNESFQILLEKWSPSYMSMFPENPAFSPSVRLGTI